MKFKFTASPYLFKSGQTLGVAQSFAAFLHLKHEGFAVAERATAGTASHRQVVYCAETIEAGVTAHVVDSAAQDHLVFALQRNKIKSSLACQHFLLCLSYEGNNCIKFLTKIQYRLLQTLKLGHHMASHQNNILFYWK